MEKVFFLEGIGGEILKRGLSNRGEMLCFGVGGKYLSRGPIDYDVMSNSEVDIVSILNVDNNLELGVVLGNEFKKYAINVPFNTIIEWINRQPSLEMSGVITDKAGDIEYNQYIYAYKKGTLNQTEMEGVMGLELK